MNWQEIKYRSSYSLSNFNNTEVTKIIGEVKEDLSSLEGNKIFLQPYYIDGNRVKYGLIQLDKRYIPLELKDGDLIRIKLTLNEPRKKNNPGGFSYYDFLKRKGIYSQGYYQGDIELIDNLSNEIRHLIIATKYKFINIIDNTSIEPYNNLIKAFLLGERDNLPDEWVNYFTLAGINHLLAISGLHIGFVVLIFMFILRRCKLTTGLRVLLLSFLLLFYLYLTGFRPSVFRAVLIAIAFLWAPYLYRKGDVLNIIGLAALMNLLINPYQLFDVGFQLSYFVVISIIIWVDIFKKFCPYYLAVSISAFIGSAPIIITYFNLFSPISIITNIWAIPLVGFIVSVSLIFLLIALFFPFLTTICYHILVYPMYCLISGAHLMSLIPLAHFEIGRLSLLNLSFIVFNILFLPFLLKKRKFAINELKRKKALNIIIISFLLIVLVNLFIIIIDNNLIITFIDVGQGDSILVRSPDKRYILIDGGGYVNQESKSNHGEYTLLPLMRSKGIREIDLVFITHFHADHALGIIELIGNRKINHLVLADGFADNFLSEELIKKAKENNIPVIIVREGDLFQIGDLVLYVLFPGGNRIAVSPNDNSLVIKLVYEQFSVLLTGDLEKEGEKTIFNKAYSLNSDILKLGHHGANTSSRDFFLEAISPQHGIISVGKNNYGHPSSKVIKKAEAYGIKIWRTDHSGAIIVKSDGFRYDIESYLD